MTYNAQNINDLARKVVRIFNKSGKNALLIGESHGIIENTSLKIRIIGEMINKSHISFLVIEGSVLDAFFLNRYLRTGDDSMLYDLFSTYINTYSGTLDNLDFWRRLKMLCDSCSPSLRIKVLGIDITHSIKKDLEILESIITINTHHIRKELFKAYYAIYDTFKLHIDTSQPLWAFYELCYKKNVSINKLPHKSKMELLICDTIQNILFCLQRHMYQERRWAIRDSAMAYNYKRYLRRENYTQDKSILIQLGLLHTSSVYRDTTSFADHFSTTDPYSFYSVNLLYEDTSQLVRTNKWEIRQKNLPSSLQSASSVFSTSSKYCLITGLDVKKLYECIPVKDLIYKAYCISSIDAMLLVKKGQPAKPLQDKEVII